MIFGNGVNQSLEKVVLVDFEEVFGTVSKIFYDQKVIWRSVLLDIFLYFLCFFHGLDFLLFDLFWHVF